ncbi:MAG: hypothetical protein IPG71_06595 [bacterium]|nr:hypothetical protein [bacterium]
MKISAVSGALKGRTDAIAIGLFDDELKSPKLTGLDRRTISAFQKLIAASRFSGKHTETVVHFSQAAQAPQLILQGLGSRKEFSWRRLRLAAGSMIRSAKANSAKHLSLFSAESFADDLDAGLTAQALTDGLVLGHWSFEHYKAKPDTSAVLQVNLYFASAQRQKLASSAIPAAQVKAEAHNLARDYGTHPANVVNTDYLKAEAKKLAKVGIQVTVLERAQLEKLGMNLCLPWAKPARCRRA